VRKDAEVDTPSSCLPTASQTSVSTPLTAVDGTADPPSVATAMDADGISRQSDYVVTSGDDSAPRRDGDDGPQASDSAGGNGVSPTDGIPACVRDLINSAIEKTLQEPADTPMQQQQGVVNNTGRSGVSSLTFCSI